MTAPVFRPQPTLLVGAMTPADRPGTLPPVSRETCTLTVEDQVVEVFSFPGTVTLGIGATGYIHPGVCVDVDAGAVAYLAAGAHLVTNRPGALERGDITVVAWDPQDWT